MFKSNFTRIAENTTKYHLELVRNYGDRFADEGTLLATAAILDAQTYIFIENSIEIDTIIEIAKQAVAKNAEDPTAYQMIATHEKFKKISKQGKPSLSAYLQYSEEDDELEEDTLFNLIFGLEVEIFAVDSPRLNRHDIEYACYQSADSIIKAIRRVNKKYNSEAMFASVTKLFMQSPKFQTTRQTIGIIEVGNHP